MADGTVSVSAGRRLATFCITLISVPVFVSSEAGAQQLGNDCDLRRFRVIQSRQIAPGQRVTWIGLPDVACPGGVEIQADSAVVWEAAGRTEFLGGFRYLDLQRELQSVNADYFEREGRLLAMGVARLRSFDGEREVRGDTVHVFEGQEGAGDDRLLATGRPAYARIGPSEPSGPFESTASYEVLGRNLRFEGERFLYADGEVEIDRDSLHATTNALSFDRTSGGLLLAGDARVESGNTQFEGRTINMTLPDDELTSMILREEAHLASPELDLTGEEIQIRFEDGGIRHLLAIAHLTDASGASGAGIPLGGAGGDSSDAGADSEEADSRRPQALADDFFLVADSIEVEAPEGVLETVFAYGRARGESRQPASSDELDPRDDVGGPADELGSLDLVLAQDWIEGDTIVATFAQAGDDGADSSGESGEAPQYVLSRLVAVGNARTLYRSPPDTQRSDLGEAPAPSRDSWAISYLVADQIILNLVAGQVEHVQAEGTVAGLQLEPEPEPAPEDGATDPAIEDLSDPVGDAPLDPAADR